MPLTRRAFLHASMSALAACAGPRGGGAPAAAPAAAGAGSPGTSDRPMKLLILGGTRFLGPALVQAARARSHALTLFNRGKSNPGLFPDLEQIHGDRDGQIQELAGRRWDAVVDTSGYVPRVVRMSAELLAPSVERYLFVSTISVYDESMPPGSDETAKLASLPDPKSEDVRAHYGALKVLCEQAVERALPGRALSVRPGLIVGPDDGTDRFTYWPVRLDRGGQVLCPGDGSDPVQVVDVRDLAAWMIAMLERRESGVYNAVGPASRLTAREMIESCRPPGSEARLTWVPWAFLEKHKVEPWSDMPVCIPAAGEGGGLAQVSIARALAKGIRFRPVAETARDTLAWWKTLPEERRRKPRAGLSTERELEVLAAWRASRT
ncbi:MAG TPA: NAD-dependent epimerase/dehydratase family protein [Anaeromyxobacteraceae bacterium]|nr:NAD-dependent epimerase/dehydratase family protein [Anaeromyxobacteraceae bacterium]